MVRHSLISALLLLPASFAFVGPSLLSLNVKNKRTTRSSPSVPTFSTSQLPGSDIDEVERVQGGEVDTGALVAQADEFFKEKGRPWGVLHCKCLLSVHGDVCRP